MIQAAHQEVPFVFEERSPTRDVACEQSVIKDCYIVLDEFHLPAIDLVQRIQLLLKEVDIAK
jgi:hypothetical protein